MSDDINSEKTVRDVIVIGASAGGIRAVIKLLARLPADLPAFIGVVIHRGATTPTNWSATLGSETQLQVLEPSDGDRLTRGCVYIAPSDRHMRFESGRIKLDVRPKEHFTRPAVDPLFRSAALTYGSRVVGILLTGGGHDGMLGLLNVTRAGGLSIVQTLAEAEDDSMPAYAIAQGNVQAVLTISEIGHALALFVRGDVFPTAIPTSQESASCALAPDVSGHGKFNNHSE